MIDLNSFGPWRDGICDQCDTLHLVVGTPEGPKCCRACWLGEPSPGSRRRPAAPMPDDVALFDVAPFESRKGGA
jgi:hypothetical protein